jgi:DNA repair exonuclease SbcCD ATPase subunit
MTNLSSYRDYCNKQSGKRDILSKQLADAKAQLDALNSRTIAIAELQLIIQEVAMATQANVVFRINSIVNKVLQSVFPTYSFDLSFEVKRGRSEAQLKFYCGDNIVNILDSSGGGVCDVAALGLRLAVWALSKSANTLLLDETTKYVSLDLQPRVAQVLKELSEALKLQIIMVSHSAPLNDLADKLFKVELDKKNVSQVM